MNNHSKPIRYSTSEMAKVCGFAIAYFLAHQIAFFFPDSEAVIMAVWPAGGIGLAAFLLSPYRRWPALVLAFYIAGVCADVMLAQRSFFAGVGYMTGNMVESLGCALLIIKMNGKKVCFTRINEVLALILGTIFVNAVSSCIGAGTAVLIKGASFGNAWWSWYVSDGLGLFIITPVIVTWVTIRERTPGLVKSFRPMECAGFIIFWCTAVWLTFDYAFNTVPVAPHPYMLIALLAWPAFRLGQHIVSVALVLLAVMAIASLLLHPDFSPLGGQNLPERLLLMQIFLGFAAATGFLLAANHAESQAAQQATFEHEQRLRSIVEGTSDAVYIKDPKGRYLLFNTAAGCFVGKNPAEVLGKDDTFLFPENQAKTIMEGDRKVMEARRVMAYEENVSGSKGESLSFYSVKGPMYDDQNNVTGLFGIARDITERKQAQEMLRVSEEKFLLISQLTPAGIYMTTSSGECLYVNERWCEMAGLSLEEALGMGWIKGIYPEDRQPVMDNWQQMVDSRGHWGKEYRFQDKDGKITWVYGLATPQTDAAGKIIGYIGLNMDITQSRQAQEKIREKDIQFRKLSSNVPGLIYQFTRKPDGTYFVPIASEGIRNIFGCSPEDVRADFAPIGRVIFTEDSARVISDIEHSARQLTPFACEFRVQIPGKSIQWVYSQSTPEKLPDGSIIWYGFNTDITQLKRAEAALQLSEERFRLLFEQAPLGYQSLDEEGHFIEVNQAWQDTLGYSRQEVIGKWFGDFLAPEFVEPFRQRFPIFKAAGKIHSEFQMLHKSGQPRFIAFEGRVGYKPNGSFKQTHCILSDITEQKQAQEALRQSEERFRFLFENAPEAIFIQSQGRFVYLNSAMVKLLGASKAEELLGREFVERIAPEYHEAIRQRIRSQRETGKPAPLMEQEYLRLDGSRISVETTAVAIRFQDSDAHMVFVRDITERKKTEEALRHEQELTSRIMETSPVGIIATNWRGEITFANACAEKILGLTRDDAAGRMYNAPNWYITDYDGNPFPEGKLPFQQVIVAGKPVYDIQHAIQRPDGQRILLSVNAAPVFSGTGEFDGMIATIEDVTEHKRAEEALRESEVQFRSLFDTMSEGVALHELITNKDGDAVDYRIIDVNPAYMNHTGLNMVQAKNQLASVFYGTGNPPYLDLFSLVAQSGKPMFFETSFSPLKKYFDISVFSPRPGWFATIFMDITQRRQTENKLRASEEKFMKAFRSNPVVMAITVIQEGRFIEVNDCFLTTLGYRREDVIGRTSLELGIFCDAGQRKALVEAVKDKGYVRNMECMVRDSSGQLHCGLFSAEIIEFQDAQYLLTIMNDITDRKKAEELLQLHQANMAHLLRLGEVGEMASGLAHEINQPLCAIANYAQACLRLMETRTDSACLGDAIKDIRAQAERAGKIIHRIKGLVRKKQPRFEHTGIKDIIQEAVDLISAEAKKREMHILVNVPDNLTPVYADFILVEQVVLNLIRNGMDAMDSPQISKKELTIQAQAGLNNMIEVCISDTGCGIPEDNMKKIFESFFTTKPDGLGIGLSLSRAIIESHSGRIWAAANAEGGTTFHFTLSTRSSTDET
jgi:PAS domain S-box-containing protein